METIGIIGIGRNRRKCSSKPHGSWLAAEESARCEPWSLPESKAQASSGEGFRQARTASHPVCFDKGQKLCSSHAVSVAIKAPTFRSFRT